MTAASLLGGMLGERLYGGYQKKLMSARTIVSFLRKPLAAEQFDVVYYEILELIEALPTPFYSKREKL
jgi:hypothetical protein